MSRRNGRVRRENGTGAYDLQRLIERLAPRSNALPKKLQGQKTGVPFVQVKGLGENSQEPQRTKTTHAQHQLLR
jgi:hypothetical protein